MPETDGEMQTVIISLKPNRNEIFLDSLIPKSIKTHESVQKQYCYRI